MNPIENFFYRYAERFNHALGGGPPDIEGTVDCFSSCFIEASPAGISCGKNDEQFRGMIPQGYAFYQSIGIKSMNIAAIEISTLDALHAMAKVHWTANFIRKDGSSGAMDFNVIYLVQLTTGSPKIFAYITGDEQKALKEMGLT